MVDIHVPDGKSGAMSPPGHLATTGMVDIHVPDGKSGAMSPPGHLATTGVVDIHVPDAKSLNTRPRVSMSDRLRVGCVKVT